MTVCKYFMQGNCRYGNRCHYEHPSGGNAGYAYSAQRQLFGGGGGQKSNNWGGGGGGGGGGGNRNFYDNKYKWVAGQNQQTQQTAPQTSTSDIVNLLINDMKDWDKNKMWPFSCVGLDKGYPCIPGFTDTCTDELRCAAYEAQKSGGINTYFQAVEKLVNDFKSKRQALQNPSMSDKQKIVSMIEDAKMKKNKPAGQGSGLFSTFGDSGSTASGGFGSGGNTGPTGTSNFGQSPLSSGQSAGTFGQANNSPFGSPAGFGAAAPPNAFGITQSVGFPGTSPFGSQTSPTANPFGGASSQTGFGQSSNPFGGATAGGSTFGGEATAGGHTFGGGTTAGGSTFGAGITAGGSTFGGTTGGVFGGTASSSVFGSKPNTSGGFGSQGANFSTPSNTGSFASSASAFGASAGSPFIAPSSGGFGNQGQQLSTELSSAYTPMEKLSKEEVDAFKAQMFSAGKIPTKPPPREFCI